MEGFISSFHTMHEAWVDGMTTSYSLSISEVAALKTATFETFEEGL